MYHRGTLFTRELLEVIGEDNWASAKVSVSPGKDENHAKISLEWASPGPDRHLLNAFSRWAEAKMHSGVQN